MKTYGIRFGTIAALLGLVSTLAAAPRGKEKPTLKVGPDLVGKVWKVWTTDLAF